MARLSAAARRKLPAKTFAGPGRSFPIPDKGHAKAALEEINHAPESARAKIRARAEKMLHPHGSGPIPAAAYNDGYMGMDDYVGMQYAAEQQQAQDQPPQKKKKGAQYGS